MRFTGNIKYLLFLVVFSRLFLSPALSLYEPGSVVVDKKGLTPAQRKIQTAVLTLKENLSPAGLRALGVEEGRPDLLSGDFQKISREGLMQLYVVYSADKEKLAGDILGLGGKIDLISERMSLIQAWVPHAAIEALAEKEYVRDIRFPDYALNEMGSVTSEGDAVLRADVVRFHQHDGSNIKVGAISNGINGIVYSRLTGDIPAEYEALSARSDGDLYSGAEGLAMMEIVHDLAPGASLAFSNCGTSAEMLNAIQILDENFNCDIIVDDIVFPGEPWFEEGPIAQKMNEINAKGKLYVCSAGNAANDKYYEGDFSGVVRSVGVSSREVHDFSGDGDWRMEIRVSPYSQAWLVLQWNDQFGLSGNDYDLLILDSTGSSIYTQATRWQNGNDDPIEFCSIYNSSDYSQNYYAVFEKYSGAERRLKFFVYNGAYLREYSTETGCIIANHLARDAVACGAIDHASPNVIESFSSRGPVRIDFPSLEYRAKPDICGIDGVVVTGNGGFTRHFYGTSAAAPHVAALAALLWSSNTSLSNTEVKNMLLNNAEDLGSTGYDYIYGHGRADAYRALGLAPSAVNQYYVYPNPFKRGMAEGIMFAGFSGAGDEEIRIFTIAGEPLISQLVFGTTTWIWDLRNAAGRPVARGIYLYAITDGAGQLKRGKIVVK